MPVPTSAEWLAGYRALVHSAGLVALGHRTQIELTGADRASFLHNLCTNEVKRLPVGKGCEAFLTSVQGKTLGHGFIFAGPDSLVFDSVPGQGETVLKHLDHYLVCEQVNLVDRTSEWSEVLLAGPQAAEVLARVCDQALPSEPLAHTAVTIANQPVHVRRVEMTPGGGFLIRGLTADAGAVLAALERATAVAASLAAFDAARIEAGFPLFGPDITAENLPQEVARDPVAISFVKGCYLGQETVARIDALGHVNKTLVGLRFDGELPAAGEELRAGEQAVGRVTSAAYSPRLEAAIGLGYVRRGSNAPGTELNWRGGKAVVSALPFAAS
jgi:folate-binding protein YgfZ